MRYIICLAPIALAACAEPRPVLVLPPVELTQCADEPVPPSLEPRPPLVMLSDIAPYLEAQQRRDLATLEYILQLRTYAGDCKAKTNGLAAWLDAAGR